MGGRGSGSRLRGGSGSAAKTSSFKTLKSLTEKITKTSMKGHVGKDETTWIGKSRGKKIAKAFRWANNKGFGDIEVSGSNLAKMRSSTYSGNEFKAARLIALKKL